MKMMHIILPEIDAPAATVCSVSYFVTLQRVMTARVPQQSSTPPTWRGPQAPQLGGFEALFYILSRWRRMSCDPNLSTQDYPGLLGPMCNHLALRDRRSQHSGPWPMITSTIGRKPQTCTKRHTATTIAAGFESCDSSCDPHATHPVSG